MLHIDKADHFSLKWDVGEREESQMGQSQRVPGKNNSRQPIQENNKSLFISLLIRTDFPNPAIRNGWCTVAFIETRSPSL